MCARPATLYSLGSALVDYEFFVTEEQFSKLQIDKGLMTLINQPDFHRYYDQLSAWTRPVKAGGGSAVNSLVTYARLGGKGSLFSILGEDEGANFFLREIQSMGIENRCILSSARPTGACLVLVTPDGERSMLTYLGVNTQLALKPFRTWRQGDSFYAESYLLATKEPCGTLMEYMGAARHCGLQTALSLSDVSITRLCRQELQELLKDGVDILFGNEEEYRNYTGEKDIEAIYSCLHAQVNTLVMTAGAAGSWICRSRKIMQIPTPRVEVLDTLGAGDTYAGAYLYLLHQRRDHVAAAHFASQAAAQVVSRIGPRLSARECQNLKKSYSARR